MSKGNKKASNPLLKPPATKRLLGAEQFRFCLIIADAGQPIDAQAISELYGSRRREEANYVKTYNQLANLLAAGVLQRSETIRSVPPHNAKRTITLWELTDMGRELMAQTREHFGMETSSDQTLDPSSDR